MKKMISLIACMLVLVLCLTACGQSAAPAEGVSLRNGGILVLRVNPEIAVEYDAEGNVSGITARNDDALAIVANCKGLIGQPTRDVMTGLVTAIGEAGYFVEEIDGEGRRITLEIEPGSSLPHGTFLDDVIADIQACVSRHDWTTPIDVEGESDFGAAADPKAPTQAGKQGNAPVYRDTDYGTGNDGVTDYDHNKNDDTDYGPGSDGITDYDGTDYKANTDYGINADGNTDYNDTDYGVNNDGVTDYGKTDYGKTDYAETKPEATEPASNTAKKDTDYGDSDYKAPSGNTSGNKTSGNTGTNKSGSTAGKDTDYGDSDYKTPSGNTSGNKSSGNTGTNKSGSTAKKDSDYGDSDYKASSGNTGKATGGTPARKNTTKNNTAKKNTSDYGDSKYD